jgi:hypothetical protein
MGNMCKLESIQVALPVAKIALSGRQSRKSKNRSHLRTSCGGWQPSTGRGRRLTRPATCYVEVQVSRLGSQTGDEPQSFWCARRVCWTTSCAVGSRSQKILVEKICKFHDMVTPKKLFSVFLGSGICNIQQWHNMTEMAGNIHPCHVSELRQLPSISS